VAVRPDSTAIATFSAAAAAVVAVFIFI